MPKCLKRFLTHMLFKLKAWSRIWIAIQIQHRHLMEKPRFLRLLRQTVFQIKQIYQQALMRWELRGHQP